MAAALPSCATTGDPSEGGLFNFSSARYEERRDEKLAVLDEINADTAQKNRQAAGLGRQIRSRR